MAESRMFNMQNGITLEAISASVENFMRTDKTMETQNVRTTDGCVIQGSQPKDGWRTISGTRLAINVQLVVVGQNLNVTVGEGEWTDKIGAAALGWFIAWPLALTAGIGAYKQKKMPQEVFAVIEKCILTGGHAAVVSGAGAAVSEGAVVCPNCKAACAGGSKFCNVCGAKLLSECPECGAPITAESKFCAQCGKPL